MKKFNNIEEITKAFIKDGWSENTSFAEVSPELAEKIGAYSIASDIAHCHKFFIMNGSDNVFDEKGEVAMYNLGNSITKCRAEVMGFSFTDNPVFVASQGLAYNYLKPSEQLVARASFELSKNVSREAFEKFMDAYTKGEEKLEFFIEYNIETNKLQLAFDTQFTYEDFNDKLIIPTSEIEDTLLMNALNAHTKEKIGRPFVCSYDASFDVHHTLEQLEERAQELYDEHDMDFSEFTNGELYELYKVCIMTPESPWGRSYDDEVFDEIFSRNPIDGKDLIDVFSERRDKEVYIDPAFNLAAESKEAFANGDIELAYEKYVEIATFLIPENMNELTDEFQDKMYGIYYDVMKEFTDDEIYEMTDYGKEQSYAELDEEER